jgi:hypothetical protein
MSQLKNSQSCSAQVIHAMNDYDQLLDAHAEVGSWDGWRVLSVCAESDVQRRWALT